jgi:hypothetical protein
LDFYPEDEPVKFHEWMDRLSHFKRHYRLSDQEAIDELQWYGGPLIEERLRLIQHAEPGARFERQCQLLVQAALPASAAQQARREFHGCRQLDRERGSTFVRRFELAAKRFRRFATPSDQDVYDSLLSQLNEKYIAELRTDTAERGHLTNQQLVSWQHTHASARLMRLEDTATRRSRN